MWHFISIRMSIRADIAVKKRQHLENNNSHNEEQCDKLETQLKEDKFTMSSYFLSDSPMVNLSSFS